MAINYTMVNRLYILELQTGPEWGVGLAHQVPLPTCLKFFVILTNEKAKVSYQTFIKELSNPPRIDTVVILQHLYHIIPNEGRDIYTTIAQTYGVSKSMAYILLE